MPLPGLWLLPPQIEGSWQFLLLGWLSATLISLSKTGFGSSVGMLSVPLMIYACGGDAGLAVGIMLPLLIAGDYAAVISWRGHWRLRTVAMLLPGVAAGIAAGWGCVKALEQLGGENDLFVDAGMKLGIGLIALGFVTLRGFQALRGRLPAFRPIFWQASAAGTMMGFTSTLAHAAGPVVAMYLLPQRMPKSRYVATTAMLFWVVNQLKLLPFFELGWINTATLGAGVFLLPGIAAGAVLGLFLHRRVGARQFAGIVYSLLAALGVHLCIQGARELWF